MSDNSAPRPINLPQFVVICGGDKVGNLALAKMIHELSGCLEHSPVPIKAPILFMCAALELADPERAQELIDDYATHADFINSVDNHLRTLLGEDWVGKMMLKHLKEGDTPDESLIFWDGDSPKDFLPFATEVGKDKIAFLRTGALLGDDLPGFRTIWIPHNGIGERISLLRRECGDL